MPVNELGRTRERPRNQFGGLKEGAALVARYLGEPENADLTVAEHQALGLSCITLRSLSLSKMLM